MSLLSKRVGSFRIIVGRCTLLVYVHKVANNKNKKKWLSENYVNKQNIFALIESEYCGREITTICHISRELFCFIEFLHREDNAKASSSWKCTKGER